MSIWKCWNFALSFGGECEVSRTAGQRKIILKRIKRLNFILNFLRISKLYPRNGKAKQTCPAVQLTSHQCLVLVCHKRGFHIFLTIPLILPFLEMGQFVLFFCLYLIDSVTASIRRIHASSFSDTVLFLILYDFNHLRKHCLVLHDLSCL